MSDQYTDEGNKTPIEDTLGKPEGIPEAKVGLTGEPLTLEQRVDNLEMILAKFIPGCEEVLGKFNQELIKTQQFVLGLANRGTSNQKKLLIPEKHRKPYKLVPEGDTLGDPIPD